MQKIVLTGPESSGKTTLARALAEAYRLPVVPEYARTYLEGRKDYSFEDLVAIARGQIDLEQKNLDTNSQHLLCDTDLLTIIIWSEVKFGRVDPWIVQQWQSQPARMYLLLYPDIPWIDDPLRENPDDRHELFAIYENMLVQNHCPYYIISGDHEERLQRARRIFDFLIIA